MENPKMSQEGIIYSKFISLMEVNEEKFIENIKENFDFKTTLFHLNQSLELVSNPDKEYKVFLGILHVRVASLRQLSPESEGLVDDFLKDQGITNIINIKKLTLEEARDFNRKLIDFFDDRLSLTILSLADNNSYLTEKEALTSVRERMAFNQEILDSEEFEDIIPDENAIATAKRRIKLVEEARGKFNKGENA